MMARANLGQLLGNLGETALPVAPNPDAVEPAVEGAEPAPVAAKPARAQVSAGPATPVPNEPVTPSVESLTPTYLRFVRKETRLREDQQNRLTLEARRLNRAKKNPGARITENSLIRVAVDLLLAQISDAVGDDEDAIRKSVTS